MEHQKTLNLLKEVGDLKSVIRKQNIINDQSSGNYEGGNEIIYKKEVLKSNLHDQGNNYIFIINDITII